MRFAPETKDHYYAVPLWEEGQKSEIGACPDKLL